jgi:hypothetical protein
MAVTYTNAVKDARMTAVVTAIGSAPGVLEIGTASMASILATITLNATSSGGVLTLSGFPKNATAAATGTAAAARIRTATGGTDIVTGLTVGTSGSDINLNNTSITSGQTVTISSATITHAA